MEEVGEQFILVIVEEIVVRGEQGSRSEKKDGKKYRVFGRNT